MLTTVLLLGALGLFGYQAFKYKDFTAGGLALLTLAALLGRIVLT
jgi:hypothetical protein